MATSRQNGGGGCPTPWSADQWAAPTGLPLLPMAGIIARGRTKVTSSSIITSVAGIGALDGGGLAGRATAGVVATDFGFPLLAMAW
jgi:hypothetical protein